MDLTVAVHLRVADYFYTRAMILMKHQNYSEANKSLGKVMEEAVAAFSHITVLPSGRPKTDLLKDASRAQQFVILAEIATNSYDHSSNEIVPFARLEDDIKLMIYDLVDNAVGQIQRFQDRNPAEGYCGGGQRRKIMEALLQADFSDFGKDGLLYDLLLEGDGYWGF